MDNIRKKLSSRIREMRKELGLSQREVAEHMDLKRSTISQIENGDRKVSAEELVGFAKLFNVSPNNLLGLEKGVKVILEEGEYEYKEEEEKKVRINVPQKNLEKFRELLIYILNKVGSKPNVGETVLYKLLYFIDFDFYEKYEEQIVGATYIKNNYGPTPVEFKKVIDDMISKGDIEKVESEYFSYPQTKYLPRRKPNLDIFTGKEIELIDDILDRLSDKNASEISEYSHEDVPWLTTDEGEYIEYESVFYRTPPYSVRDYSEDK